MRRLSAPVAILLPLAVAAAIVWLAPWQEPIVLALSGSHGIDAGDLLAFPFAAVAVAAARRHFARSPGGRAAPASAIVLGALLLLAGFLGSDGGPLTPAGGATLDGTIRQTVDQRPVPVGRWTYVALIYDGAQERLYVNGDQVSRDSAAGRLQTPENPLWIGGNRPYGEHFRGLIDDVRVYSRALSVGELRRDMARPAGPATGLAAAYTFDAGSGATAEDASGHGNTGKIAGATWARGRHGDGLRFDGREDVVRVPPAPSLNLTRAMTLSAWIRPDAAQKGWRTIVQRQTDAYFLAASSDRLTLYTGRVDDVRAALIAVVAASFFLLIATGRAPAGAARRRWWLPVALFLLGSLADVVLSRDGTLIGPMLVALWLAATASGRTERAALLVAAAACAGLTVMALSDMAGLRVPLSYDGGGTARTAALGAVFVLAGLAALRREFDRGDPWKMPPATSVLSFDAP